jgi:prepilin-type N-terminal cleavage/methylation domain-containing protein
MIKPNDRYDCGLPGTRRSSLGSYRFGLNLIEVIVVTVIIGILTSTLLVGVQAARESARKTSCRNNLRQIGLAVQAHESSRQYYPTNGWGFRLIPDAQIHPRYGQAGGWIFQLLPYLEQKELYDQTLVAGSADVARGNKVRLLTTPVAVFNCPSRTMSVMIEQRLDPEFYLNLPRPPEKVASADYAVNGGTYSIFPLRHPTEQGPGELSSSYLERFPWPTAAQNNGAAFMQVRLRASEFRRGTSNVLWAAERYIKTNRPAGLDDGGNDQSMYSGHCSDTIRFTAQPPRSNQQSGDRRTFGSSHAAGVIGVLMDGAVYNFSFDIDEAVFRAYGRRNDAHLPVLDL